VDDCVVFSILSVRLYLDACCLNRPFDDQAQPRIHFESEAVLAILDRVEAGDWTLLSSAALEFELRQNPMLERRIRTLHLLSAARDYIELSETVSTRASELQRRTAIAPLDALHLAAAESLQADVFLTTDDRLLRAARRLKPVELTFQIANPLGWLTEGFIQG
jgi:predicted nucleic acid-binding protein